jgi:hypothetical protein
VHLSILPPKKREEVSSTGTSRARPTPRATVHVHVHIRVRSRDRTEAVACSHPIRRCKDINRAETQLRTPIRRETQLKPHFGYKKKTPHAKRAKRKKNRRSQCTAQSSAAHCILARGHRPAAPVPDRGVHEYVEPDAVVGVEPGRIHQYVDVELWRPPDLPSRESPCPCGLPGRDTETSAMVDVCLRGRRR